MAQFLQECPVCGGQLAYAFDEWGHTPFHLHCLGYKIDIGAQATKDCLKLLQENHVEDTHIEYWNGKIQEHWDADKIIVDRQRWFVKDN